MRRSASCIVLLILCCASGLTAATPVTLQINKVTNSVILTWAAPVGYGYTVQAASSVSGPWSAQTLLTAGASGGSWTDSNLFGVGQRFYRLLETPDLSLTNLFLNGDGLASQILSPAPFGDQSAFTVACQTCAAAIYYATVLNGMPTFTGTLTQTPANSLTYSPTPTDRLVLQYTNGLSPSYYVMDVNGDFSGDYNTFLQNNHRFVFRVVNNPTMDMTFTSLHSTCGTNFTAAVGILISGSLPYTANLSLAGTYCFTSDGGGTTLQDDHTLTGTISIPGYSLMLNHTRHFQDVYTASTAQDTINNRLTIGADVYQWVNVFKRRDFTGGRPAHFNDSFNYWQASGAVLKNGNPYGNYQFVINLHLTFQVATPTDTIVVEHYSWL